MLAKLYYAAFQVHFGSLHHAVYITEGNMLDTRMTTSIESITAYRVSQDDLSHGWGYVHVYTPAEWWCSYEVSSLLLLLICTWKCFNKKHFKLPQSSLDFVDDNTTFILWCHSHSQLNLFTSTASWQPSIEFMRKIEENRALPFLGTRNQETSRLNKPTNTERYIHF